MSQRTHTIGTGESYGWPMPLVSGHQIQRIAGLPLSWVEPAPPARCTDDVAHPTTYLLFDEPEWTDDRTDERTPLDLPVPDDITHDDYVMPAKPSDYDGFDSRDTKADWLPKGRHSRPQELDPSDLERMADQILAADDAGQLRTIKPMQVPGLLPVDESGWRYLPHTYTLGWKDCPRCHGTGRPFAQKPCRYCSQQGGWQITRTRMTPWHPQHGWALTPPRLDDAAIHSTHWRTRAASYTGHVRVRDNTRPSEAIMAEIRRRHFAKRTRQEIDQLTLVTRKGRYAIAA